MLVRLARMGAPPHGTGARRIDMRSEGAEKTKVLPQGAGESERGGGHEANPGETKREARRRRQERREARPERTEERERERA